MKIKRAGAKLGQAQPKLESEISETLCLSLNHFPGLGLENARFPGLGLGLSFEYS